MPIYEYRRPNGTTFEVMQKFSDDPLTADPETGVPVERVFHAPAIHFKGKGFHNTDYGTRRKNRELERSAEDGANNWDDKREDQKRDEAKSKASDAKPAKAEKKKSDGKKPAKKAA